MRTTFWSKNPKNHILTFGQQKTSNKCCHSNQSPILKISPSDYLHFCIFPSANINCSQAIKPFIQPYPNFTVSHIGFMAVKTCKNIICSFDTSCINYSPQVNKKINMTKIEQIEHFQTCVHTFCLLMPVGDFHHHTLYNVWFKSPKNKHKVGLYCLVGTQLRFCSLCMLVLFPGYLNHQGKFLRQIKRVSLSGLILTEEFEEHVCLSRV